jgi:adenylate kinase
MKSISEGMGAGLIKHVEFAEVLNESWVEFLTLDLKMRPSKVFTSGVISWHSPNGLGPESMENLNKEFNLFRGLFPLKIFMTGPPAAGKTHFASKLSESYGVPHIKIGDLINAAMKFQNPLGEEIRAKIEELKDFSVAEYEKTRNKKKDPELDRATVKVRLPDDILYRIVRLQMNSAACKNKGFILDGYPRTQQDAKSIFLEKIPEDQNQEGENPDDPFPGYTINTEILPQYVIILNAEDAALKQRVKDLPVDKTANTHFTEAHMDRRLKIYRDANPSDSGHSVQDFFAKSLAKLNGEVPISENVKTVHAISSGDMEQLVDI